MESGRRQHNRDLFTAINSVKLRRFDKAFEPYRNAFVVGDLQQQKFIINELVSSLILAESSKLCEERGRCMEGEDRTSPLEEIFTCSLCEEFFHIPVTLVCGHTFCLQCLETYQRHEQTTCPSCGHESTLRYASNIVLRELSRMWFPEKTDIRNDIAKAKKLLNERRTEEFKEFMNDLVTKYPNNVDILYLSANAYKSMKNYSQALKYLDLACSLAPFCSKVFYARGEVLASLEEPEEAMAMFLRASALKQNDTNYRSSLTLHLEILLSNICDPSIACSPTPSSNAETGLTTKNLVKGLPVKSELNLDESVSAVRNLSSKRQFPHDAQRQLTTNFAESFRTNPTDHSNESTRKALPDEILVNEGSFCEVKETENIQDKEEHLSSVCPTNTTVTSTSNIPSELECNMCFKLIYDPVTTPCGHSLCQSCLRRCLDHRFECPCCRTNLQTYLEHLMVGNVRTCEVLERILLLKFNEDYQARRISYKNELFEFAR